MCKRGLHYLFVLIFCFIQSAFLFGQSLSTASDSMGGVWDIQNLLTEVFDSSTIQALSETGILEEYAVEVFDEYKTLFKSESNSFLKISQKKIKLPAVNTSLESKFVKNRQSATNQNWTNLSHLNIGTAINVFNLPLNLNVQGTFLNNELNWNLSGLNINFDQKEFLQNLALKQLQSANADLKDNPLTALRNTDLKEIFSPRLPNPNLPDSPFDLSSAQIIKNELKFKLLTYIVNHPKYQEIMTKGVAQKDSLVAQGSGRYKNKKEEIIQAQDSLLLIYEAKKKAAIDKKDSLQTKYKQYKNKVDQLEDLTKAENQTNLKKQLTDSLAQTAIYEKLNGISAEYRGSWEERKKYFGDSLSAIKQNLLSGISKEEIQKMSKDSLLAIINTSKSKPLPQKIFERISKLNIGQTVIDDHWFLAENLSLNGALLRYEGANYSYAGALGAQRFDFSILPLLGFSFPKSMPDRKYLYAAVGYKMTDYFELKFSTLNSREKFNEFSSGLPFERDNNVFHVSGITNIAKGLKFTTDLAYARTNGIVVQVPELNPENNINNAAGEFKLAYDIPNTTLSIAAGYFFIGPQYLSLGNPFIRTDQKGLTFSLSGSLWNRLNLDVTARKGRSTLATATDLGRSDLNLNGTANIILTKNLSFTASVYPNITNYQYNQLFQVQSNLWSTSYDLQHSIQKEKITAINNLTYSNSINEFILQDSSSINNYDGLIYYGNMLFANGMGWNVLAMGWSEKGVFKNGFDNTSLQLSYLWQKEKLQLQLGILVGEETNKELGGRQEMVYGISAGIDLPLFKNWNIGMQSRLPLNKSTGQSASVLQEYISTKMSFNF